jgi:hypothetical protein
MSYVTSNGQIQSNRISQLKIKNKFCALDFIRKCLPTDVPVITPLCTYVQHQHTSQQSLSYNHEGAEGWARVAREFDLQQETSAH